MTQTTPPLDTRQQEILRHKDDLWARAFSLPGGAALEALLDWIERRP